MISESDVEVKRDALRAQLGVQLDGVDEVAVVGERELAAVAAGAGAAVHGLGVLPLVGARRRVAHVPDREVAGERAQVVLLEDLVDEAERALGDDVAAVARQPRSRPTPGRGAAARTARSTRDARRRAPGAYIPNTPHSSRGPSRSSREGMSCGHEGRRKPGRRR